MRHPSLVKYLQLIVGILLIHSTSAAQTVTLPINFEGGSVVTSDFFNFNGGTGTVEPNPSVSGINTSATVGRVVRLGGQVWAGTYLTTATNMDFSVSPIICMKVYTTAPVGTNVTLKLEGCGGPCFYETSQATTVSGAWETICFDFTGQPANFDRLVFLFDLGNFGNGLPSSTYYFDDVEQYPTLPLPFTPGSEYFCPSGPVTFTYPGTGSYNWYSDPAGATLVQSSSATYTSPVLSGETSYYVQDQSSTPFPEAPVGPSVTGGTAIGNSITVSTFFTSNLDNGFFHSVEIVLHIPTGPPPLNTCTYTVEAFNLTQGTSRTLTQSTLNPTNYQRRTYTFGTPLPIFLGDQIEMRITSVTTHPCYCNSSGFGDNANFLPFPSSTDPQVTFTSHSSNGVSNSLMSGVNYRVSGDYVDPAFYQVNAIVDCSNPLPVELTYFSVKEDNGAALLSWTTASEIDNDRFMILRTTNGLVYETIGWVDGAGNSSSQIDYSFIDASPKDGLSYYRLKQVDHDGTEDMSELVAFYNSSNTEFRVFPNPTAEQVNVYLGQEYENVKARVYDFNGTMVAQQNFRSAESLTLSIHGRPGNYIIEIQSNDIEIGLFKVVKE